VARQSENRKAQAGSSFESAMAEQIGIDGAIGDGQAKARDQMNLVPRYSTNLVQRDLTTLYLEA
jgi:hypothetical protein